MRRYFIRARARPHRDPRLPLLRRLARVLTEEQLERAAGVRDVEALRELAESFGVVA